jgi:chromosome segregation ATPase
MQQELSSATADRNELSQEKSSLHSQSAMAQKAFTEVQEKLTMALTELATSSRQLHGAQAELRNANRRAEEAEKTQKDLQTEGTNLMRSLDEMRPKIVELTGVKLELGEQVDALEQAMRSRDATIMQLESAVDEIRDQKESAEKLRAEILAAHLKEQSSAMENSTELQKAFAELQAEFEISRASVLTLEAERSRHHQAASRQLEEIDRLTNVLQTQAEELSSTQRECAELQNAREEHASFLEGARIEIESLRAEVTGKDEEMERLKQAVSSSPSPTGRQSLDGEILSAVRQQHALDLSAAHSNIRALETSVFEAEAKSHILQKQVGTLQDELTQLRKASRIVSRSFSPGLPSRPSSRVSNQGLLTRNGLKPGNLAPPPSRSVFDHGLPAETRHKRRVSLSMLKARIDSEIAAASSGGHPSSGTLSPDPHKRESSVLPTVLEPHAELEWPQAVKRLRFLDESHIFWCTSCHGDLVIL